jgi:hypothetical protein
MVRKAAIVAVLVVAVGGCTASLKQSNEAGGVIALGELIQGEGEALRIADAECAKFGKVARIRGKGSLDTRLYYDCVPKQ